MKSNAPLSAGTPNTATALHCTTSQTTHVILVLVTKQKHQTTNKTHSTSTETGSYKIHTQICFYTKLGLHEKHKFREWMLNFWVSITVTLQWIHWWTLNWNYHIQQVECKISRNRVFLARLKHYLPQRLLPCNYTEDRNLWLVSRLRLGMHDEIFQYEIFKNFMEILKYFKTPSLKYFMKFLIF